MKKLVILIIFLLGNISSFAGHIAGGAITYQCVSGKKYKVIVKIWRDCNGIQISQSNLVIRGDTGAVVGTISTQTKVGTYDISLADTNASCGATNACNSSSGAMGYQEHVWSMNVDFALYAPNCQFTLVWEQSGRSTNGNTGQAGTNFMILSYINVCYDSASRELIKGNSPSIELAHNQGVIYNLNYTDSYDYFDSISYELTTGLLYWNTNFSYVGNYNANRPLTFFGFPNYNLGWPAGFRLNPVNGNIKFRPTQNNQIGSIVYKIKGWKEINDTMRLLGWVMEEAVHSVVSHPYSSSSDLNILPVVDPIYVCAGSSFCMERRIQGSTSSDSIYAKWVLSDSLMNIDTLVWKDDSVIFKLCFSPDTSRIRKKPYEMYLETYKYSCPDILKKSMKIMFIVVPSVDSSVGPKWNSRRSCNQLDIWAEDTSGSGYPLYVKQDGGSYVIDSLHLSLTDTGWFRFDIKQEHLGCDLIQRDSIYIDSLYSFVAKAAVRYKPCANEELTIHAASSGGLGWQSLLWSDSSSADSFVFTITQDTSFSLWIKDSSGCVSSDTFPVRMNPVLSSSTTGIFLCTELTADSVSLQATASGGTAPYTYSWLGIGLGNNFAYFPPLLDTTLFLEITDSVNCSVRDSVFIDRYIPHYPIANPDTTGCFIGALILKPSNKVSVGTYYWIGMGAGDSIRYYPPLGINNKVLSYMDTIGCVTYDTVKITNHANPNLSLPQDTVVCSGSALQIDATVYSGKKPYTYEWIPYTTVSDTFVQDIFYQSTRVYVKLTDSTRCFRIDSMDILINSIPQISVQSPYSVCSGDSFVSLSAISGSLNGVWQGTGVSIKNGTYWVDLRNLSMGNHSYIFESQNSSGNCTAKDNLQIIINPSPGIDAGLDTGLCVPGNGVFRAIANGGILPYSYVWNADTSYQLDSLVQFLSSDSTFYIEVIDSNQCSAMDSVSAFFFQLPVAYILFPYGDTMLCEGQEIFVEGDTSQQQAATNFFFNYSIQNAQAFIPDSSFTLVFEAITLDGCFAKDSLRITINPNPVILQISGASMCEDAGIFLLDSLASPVGGAWFGAGVWTDSSSMYFSPDSSGSGAIMLTYLLPDTNTGCYDTAATSILVEEKTIVDFTADSILGEVPLHVSFDNQSTGGLQSSFLWHFGDGDSSEMENPAHVYQSVGVFTVNLSIEGTYCQSSIVKTAYIEVDSITSGVGLRSFRQSEVSVYPNPGKGIYQLTSMPENSKITVYDNLGKKVAFVEHQPSSDRRVIDISEHAKGIYLIYIQQEDGRAQTLRIVKE